MTATNEYDEDEEEPGYSSITKSLQSPAKANPPCISSPTAGLSPGTPSGFSAKVAPLAELDEDYEAGYSCVSKSRVEISAQASTSAAEKPKLVEVAVDDEYEAGYSCISKTRAEISAQVSLSVGASLSACSSSAIKASLDEVKMDEDYEAGYSCILKSRAEILSVQTSSTFGSTLADGSMKPKRVKDEFTEDDEAGYSCISKSRSEILSKSRSEILAQGPMMGGSLSTTIPVPVSVIENPCYSLINKPSSLKPDKSLTDQAMSVAITFSTKPMLEDFEEIPGYSSIVEPAMLTTASASDIGDQPPTYAVVDKNKKSLSHPEAHPDFSEMNSKLQHNPSVVYAQVSKSKHGVTTTDGAVEANSSCYRDCLELVESAEKCSVVDDHASINFGSPVYDDENGYSSIATIKRTIAGNKSKTIVDLDLTYEPIAEVGSGKSATGNDVVCTSVTVQNREHSLPRIEHVYEEVNYATYRTIEMQPQLEPVAMTAVAQQPSVTGFDTTTAAGQIESSTPGIPAQCLLSTLFNSENEPVQIQLASCLPAAVLVESGMKIALSKKEHIYEVIPEIKNILGTS